MPNFLKRIPKKWRDVAARAGWTAAEVVVSAVSIEALNLPRELIPVAATGLSVLKSWIATKVGNPNTATFDTQRRYDVAT